MDFHEKNRRKRKIIRDIVIEHNVALAVRVTFKGYPSLFHLKRTLGLFKADELESVLLDKSDQEYNEVFISPVPKDNKIRRNLSLDSWLPDFVYQEVYNPEFTEVEAIQVIELMDQLPNEFVFEKENGVFRVSMCERRFPGCFG